MINILFAVIIITIIILLMTFLNFFIISNLIERKFRHIQNNIEMANGLLSQDIISLENKIETLINKVNLLENDVINIKKHI